jgi:chromosome segregation ATPase
MQRVYGVVEDELVHRIDEAAGEDNLSRAQWIRFAIESYFNRDDEEDGPVAVKLRTEAVNLRTALDEQSRQIMHLEETLAVKDGELVVKSDELDQARAESTQQWEDLRALKSEVSQLKRELEESRTESRKLREELTTRQLETEKASAEAGILRTKLESFQDTLKIKNGEIDFLRATIHQMAERLPPALPPSEEEIKAKRWWKFWGK